jgi:uncharacterized protein YndB with AHSA1/START domain
MNEDEHTLSFECEVDQPPAQVWRALTDPALLAQWLLPNDFVPEQGHAFTFEADSPIACEVLAIERERSLQLRWRERRLDSVVTFTLTPAVGGGTHLRLEHGGVERLRTAFSTLACANDRMHRAELEDLGRGFPDFRCAA